MSMMSLDSLCIDGVVLLVRTDELDENDPIRIVDGRDKAIFIASDIEDHASVFQDARSTKIGLDVRRGLPLGLEDMAMPSKKWLLRVGILRSLVECPKGREG
jgi:hypothetical protein